ncbi:PH domain-containing protein [Nakamurella silvestris]|nr:PH domain-containing protein [Nakamurella silvestris]
MAYPDNLLARGERVVLRKHPHWKVLVLPALFFILIIAGAFFLASWITNRVTWDGVAYLIIAVVAVILLVFLSIAPFLRWQSEHFVISTHHVFFRTGIVKRREHQIPLGRIQNLETNVTFWGRILGYGDLVVESAADQPLPFYNVASLPKVQSTLNQLIDDDRDRLSGRAGQTGDSGLGDGGNYDRGAVNPTEVIRRPENT